MKKLKLTQSIVLRLIQLTVGLTGFSALVYEVVWQKYMANFLGSEAKSIAFVLAVFLGGLAVGYAAFGRLSRRLDSRLLIKATGWVEFLIGVWALLFPSLYDWFWTAFGPSDPASAFASLYDFSLTVALMGVPTVLMGGTLPLLTQALSRDVDDASPVHARIYATNTAGACLGCLAAGFYLLPSFGHVATLMRVGPINLISGLLLIGLGSSTQSEGRVSNPPKSAKFSFQIEPAFVLAGLAGFCSIMLQTLLIRVIGISAGSSEYSFSMVISIFVLLLAVGASRMIQTKDRSPTALFRNQVLAAAGVFLFYVLGPLLPYCVHRIRILFAPTIPSFYVFYLALMAFLCLLLLPSVGAMGRTMPLLFHRTKSAYRQLGSRVGHLYLWNTIGCVAGTLIGGYWLLHWLSVDTLILTCGVLLVVSSAFAAWIEKPKSALFRGACGLAALSCLALLAPRWPAERLAIGTFREITETAGSYSGAERFHKSVNGALRVLSRRDDPNTSVAVVETPEVDQRPFPREFPYTRSLMVNGKSDGSSFADLDTMLLLAHLSMMLSPNEVESVGVVGYGLGITVGSLALYPEVSSIDIMEISSQVREHARYFDHVNHESRDNPKVKWYIGDAYRILSARDKKYSLIISEPSNPWVVGVERLFTQEFYEKAKSKLRQGGVFSQWIGVYNLAPSTLGMIVRTFSSVFPSVKVFSTNSGDIVLVGADSASMAGSSTRIQRRFSDPAVRRDLNRIGVKDPEFLFRNEVIIPDELSRLAPIHTLVTPKLSYRGGRDAFLGLSTNLSLLVRRPEVAPWVKTAQRRWLGFEYLLSNPDVDWKAFQAKVCEQPESGFFPKWSNSHPLCSMVLLAMAAQGKIAPGNMFRESDRQLLRDFSQEAPLVPNSKDLSAAEWAIQVFSRADSPLLNLRGDRLMEKSKVCLEAKKGDVDLAGKIGCLFNLTRTLYVNGKLPEGKESAQKLLVFVSGQASSKPMEELERTAIQAELAWKKGP